MTEHRGMVLRAQGAHYDVLDEAGVVPCRARRRLERPDARHPEFPVVGDEVAWKLLSGAGSHREGVIERVFPRRTAITRSRFGSKHVVVANLDRLVVVAAVRDPTVDRGLVDQLLAAAEHNGMSAVVCFNKIDLAEPGEIEGLVRVYEAAGYAVVCTSAEKEQGVEALREQLRGHACALMGPSGAGKSRLLGRLQPGLKVRTGAVNTKTGQGRHTTTRVDLHRTDFGALIADTPGVRDFGLWEIEPLELRDLLPEFREAQSRCRYDTCTHIPEPGCAVLEAVASGAIDAGRYRSYQSMLGQLQQSDRVDREGRARKERGR